MDYNDDIYDFPKTHRSNTTLHYDKHVCIRKWSKYAHVAIFTKTNQTVVLCHIPTQCMYALAKTVTY